MEKSKVSFQNINMVGIKNDYIFNCIEEGNDFYESEILTKWQKYFVNSATVLDIGANIGNHTVFFSTQAKCNKIYSFEPIKDVFEILKENIAINNINAEAFNMAIGDKQGFVSIKDSVENNAGGTSFAYADQSTQTEVTSIDLFFADKQTTIDFVKIDVEGFEVNVLNGMKKCLETYKPLLWIEIDPTNIDDVFQIITENGYHVLECDFGRSINVLFKFGGAENVALKDLIKEIAKYKDLSSERKKLVDKYYHSFLEQQEKTISFRSDSEKNKEFYKNEQAKVSNLKQVLSEKEESLKGSELTVHNLNDLLENNKATIGELNDLLVQSETKIKNLRDLLVESENKNRDLRDQQITLREKNVEIMEKLHERLNSEEETLLKLRELIYRNNDIEAKYNDIYSKYDLLRRSKLGRLTLKYWSIMDRIRKK